MISNSIANQPKYDSDDQIKPQLVNEDVAEILRKNYGFEGGIITEMNGYDDLNFRYVHPTKCNNPHIGTPWPQGYVLKVINSRDSYNTRLQDAQSNLMLFLKKNGVGGPVPVKNVLGNYFSVEKLPLSSENGVKQRIHVVKLLEYQPGILLKHITNTFHVYYEVGAIAATLNKTLKDFRHPAFQTHENIWHLCMLGKVKSYTYVVKNMEMKEMVETSIDEFLEDVVPVMMESQKQIIHGDLNSQNIVCNGDNEEWHVSAIIDWGDAHLSYPLYEIAICMFYTMVDCKEKMLDHFIGSGHTLAGYVKTVSTMIIDYSMLKKCIAARLCQSYVLGLVNSTIQPENNYIIESLVHYPQLLSDIMKTPISNIQNIWDNIVKDYMKHQVSVK